MKIKKIIKEIFSLKDVARRIPVDYFFKTGEGTYSSHDKFIGVKNPVLRSLAKKYMRELSLDVISELLKNEYHEVRLFALMTLVLKYEKEKNFKEKKILFDFYMNNLSGVNNWDLVDVSAYQIVGNYLLDTPRDILYKMAKSKNMWERRISIVSTLALIKNKETQTTFDICDLLLKDKEDLLHKACGWMLRELGKVSGESVLDIYLKDRYKEMPRTMLRYSIERMSKEKRDKYLKGLF